MADSAEPDKRPPYDLVLVRWTDIVNCAGWKSLETAKLEPLHPVITTGYLIHRDVAKIVVAQSFAAGYGEDSQDEVTGYIVISSASITEIRVLERA